MCRSNALLVAVIIGLLAYMGGEPRADIIVPSDLIACWELDDDLTDSAPTIQGEPGPGSDGAYTGGVSPTFVAGRDGSALDMRAVGNNYVRTDTYLDGGQKSVILWANSTYTGDAFWVGNEPQTTNRLYVGQRISSLSPWLGAGASNSAGGSF